MDKEEVIELLKNTLQSRNYDYSLPPLVNFVDHEIFWDRIADYSIETLTNLFDEVPWVQQ